jgi:Bifunctional DNA primase/polymerase, N-terminal
MTPLDRALELVEQGYRVFFCGSDKRPTSEHGFRDAADTPQAVFALWHLHPGDLVGVVTGEDDADGIDVLDIDVEHLAARVWWHLSRTRLPQTRIHRTGRGGFHVLFRHRPGMRCSASRIAIGVDVRGDGGFAIWWPAAGQPVLCDSSAAPWPEWLAELAGPLV